MPVDISSERRCAPSRLHRGIEVFWMARLGSAMCVLADLQNAVMSISEAGFEVAVEEVRTLGGE
jgi:hypothetical protein